MNIVDLKEVFEPFKNMSDRQIDPAVLIMLDKLYTLNDNTEVAVELLWILDNIICWAWGSSFVVIVFQTMLDSWCENNNIDKQTILDSSSRRYPLEEAQ